MSKTMEHFEHFWTRGGKPPSHLPPPGFRPVWLPLKVLSLLMARMVNLVNVSSITGQNRAVLITKVTPVFPKGVSPAMHTKEVNAYGSKSMCNNYTRIKWVWFSISICAMHSNVNIHLYDGRIKNLKRPGEEFELTANSLSAHIETHGKLIWRT